MLTNCYELIFMKECENQPMFGVPQTTLFLNFMRTWRYSHDQILPTRPLERSLFIFYPSLPSLPPSLLCALILDAGRPTGRTMGDRDRRNIVVRCPSERADDDDDDVDRDEEEEEEDEEDEDLHL